MSEAWIYGRKVDPGEGTRAWIEKWTIHGLGVIVSSCWPQPPQTSWFELITGAGAGVGPLGPRRCTIRFTTHSGSIVVAYVREPEVAIRAHFHFHNIVDGIMDGPAREFIDMGEEVGIAERLCDAARVVHDRYTPSSMEVPMWSPQVAAVLAGQMRLCLD